MDRDGREMGERWERVGAFEYTHIFEYTRTSVYWSKDRDGRDGTGLMIE